TKLDRRSNMVTPRAGKLRPASPRRRENVTQVAPASQRSRASSCRHPPWRAAHDHEERRQAVAHPLLLRRRWTHRRATLRNHQGPLRMLCFEDATAVVSGAVTAFVVAVVARCRQPKFATTLLRVPTVLDPRAERERVRVGS